MPALALAETVREIDSSVEPVLIGSDRGVERDILPTRDFRYYLLPSEPIYRRQWWRNARWPMALLRLRRRLAALFDEERPSAVLGTGGYASAPVVWYGQRSGLPTALQEQNAIPGLATRWLTPRSRYLFLGLPEAREYLSPGRDTGVIDSGNPIVRPEFSIRGAAREHFGLDEVTPTVLVTGGSQGSLAINRTVAKWLDQGGGQASNLLWVTGRTTHGQFAHYHRPPGVQVFDFLDPMADAYAVANMAVCRAGAVTVAELCAWGLPSILIPLPTAAGDHQTRNAEAMARSGAAWFLPQADLTPERFGDRIESLILDPEVRIEMSMAANERGRPNAAVDIASQVLTLLQ
jgi:UDP-N-acetylglucosamine--N-acetylmuramyl-(pentapeptide) pyrophosphoryl-undecaprenol N-acetylglucosamine transferase